MTTVIPVQLEDGLVVYVEAQEGTAIAPRSEETEEQRRGGAKGITQLSTALRQNSPQSMQMIQSTIRAYTLYSLNAFKNLEAVNVDEVTLEFGINLSADAGIPYIASGKAQSNLKITVKCSYNDKSAAVPTKAAGDGSRV